MASASKKQKCGSRVWLEQKLKAIEAFNGEYARVMAANKWAEIVWDNPDEAGYKGADAVERIHKLCEISASLKDEAAKQKIIQLLKSDDDQEITRILDLLDDKEIKEAIRSQGVTEEQICSIAKGYSTPENPTGHLQARRLLRRKTKQAVATLNMTLGLVGENASHYATEYEINLRNQQKARWAKFGALIYLTNGDKSVSMLEVIKSAHGKKIAEVYAMIKGLESYAKAAGLTWAFLTLTAPARMHSNPAKGKNTWNKTTPAQAHKWIHEVYHKTEARLRTTHGIVLSGVRVVEPHKDACPHWHLLVFAHPSEMAAIEATFRQQSEWKSEQGMKFMLDDGRATAASYCFKYIMKTINSIDKLTDEFAGVDAWRSTWGIRGFQWIGLPRIQLWRDLRAVQDCPNDDPLMAGIWRAAHRGDAHAFIGLAGGLNVKSKDRPISSHTTRDAGIKSIEFRLKDSGEIIQFDFAKWQQTKIDIDNTKENNIKGEKIEVILNYPRKSKTSTAGDVMRKEISPAWVDAGYNEPEPRKIYSNQTDKPYFFDEEKEKYWRTRVVSPETNAKSDDFMDNFVPIKISDEELAALFVHAELRHAADKSAEMMRRHALH